MSAPLLTLIRALLARSSSHAALPLPAPAHPSLRTARTRPRHPYDEATAAKRNRYGAKVFFYAAQVIDPYEVNRDPKIPDDMAGVSALPESDVGDWAWLHKDELAERMDGALGEYLQHLLN